MNIHGVIASFIMNLLVAAGFYLEWKKHKENENIK